MVRRATWSGLLLMLISIPGWALPPRAELLPGTAATDWLLIIEADGERQSNELVITPLLRQFAVGRVSISRVSTPVQQLTRWHIPLHLSGPDNDVARVIPPLTLGADVTPALTLPARTASTTALPQHTAPTALEMQATLDHQGPLYPGQPVIYRLTVWLPPPLQDQALGELRSPHFTSRRLGNDEWLAPVQRGLPGRLTRSWLIQANAPGLWQLDSPPLQGQLINQQGDEIQRVTAKAAPLWVRVDQAPTTSVATRLILTQRVEPATTGAVGEPLIRILTLRLENGDGSQSQLAPLMAQQLPPGLQALPDGERLQERYHDGNLLFEREWRQTLVADQGGKYLLPPINVPWFNTQTGRIEQASVPATLLTFKARAQQATDGHLPATFLRESLWWALLALALRALRQHGPRWYAFYRLQRALWLRQPDSSRKALIHWARLRWPGPWPDRGHPQIAMPLSELERACFSHPRQDPPLAWHTLARSLRPCDTVGIAQLIYLLARVS